MEASVSDVQKVLATETNFQYFEKLRILPVKIDLLMSIPDMVSPSVQLSLLKQTEKIPNTYPNSIYSFKI